MKQAMYAVRRLTTLLPEAVQLELKKAKYAWQLRRNTFRSNEPEFVALDKYVHSGDWVIDVGANIGHYTKRLSDLVGSIGRVMAFEPMPATFSILAANVQRFAFRNVSLFNVALSDRSRLVGMAVPQYEDGLKNYYQAHLTSGTGSALNVMALPLDILTFEARIALVKVDAEGHEESVLAGMHNVIERNRPTLIVETGKPAVIDALRAKGYRASALPGSPNVLFTHTDPA